MKKVGTTVLLVLVIIGLVALIRWATNFLANLQGPGEITTCSDDQTGKFYDKTIDPEGFRQCVQAKAKRFIERDYAESKDLGKTFLTLIAGILVASVTFSEKIVDVGKSNTIPMVSMIACWFLLLGAIVACGIALALMSAAVGMTTYKPDLDFRDVEEKAIYAFLSAGVSFSVALLAMIVAGISSLVHRRHQSP